MYESLRIWSCSGAKSESRDFTLEGVDVHENFGSIGALDAFFRSLFLVRGKSLTRDDNAIIFDVVQLFPPVRQAVKALVKDGCCRHIETGSLISIRENVKDAFIPSEEALGKRDDEEDDCATEAFGSIKRPSSKAPGKSSRVGRSAPPYVILGLATLNGTVS